MPEVDIHIGGRVFQVACQNGEEHFLQSAAALLDTEAQTLNESLGRVPETRMLLMAGLMLADKAAGLEEELRLSEKKLAEQLPSTTTVEHVEVEVLPAGLQDMLAQITEQTETLADQLEQGAA